MFQKFWIIKIRQISSLQGFSKPSMANVLFQVLKGRHIIHNVNSSTIWLPNQPHTELPLQGTFQKTNSLYALNWETLAKKLPHLHL